MPSSSQYGSDCPPGTAGGAPTTGAALPGRPGPVQAPPPVMVTNVLPGLVPAWMTCDWMTIELCANPDR